MRRLLRLSVCCKLALLLLLAGCASPGTGIVGSPEQIREMAKIKDAVSICVQLNTPWGPQRTSVLSVDRGLIAEMSVDKECGVSLKVLQPEPKKGP